MHSFARSQHPLPPTLPLTRKVPHRVKCPGHHFYCLSQTDCHRMCGISAECSLSMTEGLQIFLSLWLSDLLVKEVQFQRYIWPSYLHVVDLPLSTRNHHHTHI